MPTPPSSLRGSAGSRSMANSFCRAIPTSACIRSTSAANVGTSTTRSDSWMDGSAACCRAASTTRLPAKTTRTQTQKRETSANSFGFVTLHAPRRPDASTSLAATRTTLRPGSNTTRAAIPGSRPTTATRVSMNCSGRTRWPGWNRRNRRGSSRASSASACAAGHAHGVPPATARASRRSRPKAEAPRPRCSSPARFAGCTERVHPRSLHPKAARLHRQPPGCCASGGSLQRLPLREPRPRGLPGRLQSAGSAVCAATRWVLRSSTLLASIAATPSCVPSGYRSPNSKASTSKRPRHSLRQSLAYRVWYDQRRGWRYTNPNLEQLGLVCDVEYLGLEALAAIRTSSTAPTRS
jgi:hypothetical protein